MNSTTRLTGYDAIAYAEQHGVRVCKYADPTEGARDDLTPDEAREIAAEDPGLIYLDIQPSCQAAAEYPHEAAGLAALERLVRIAHADHGGAVRVRRLLLGLYNGSAFPFDLTDLRMLDEHVRADAFAVLAMDADGPRVEIHKRPGAEVIETWAAEAWPGRLSKT